MKEILDQIENFFGILPILQKSRRENFRCIQLRFWAFCRLYSPAPQH